MDYPVFPLVSVCMTTYNHEAYLAQAIERCWRSRPRSGSSWCWATIAVRTPRPLFAANTRRNTPAACVSSRASATWAGVPTTSARSRPAAGNTWPTATATTGGATPQVADAGRPAGVRPLVRDAIRAPATITRTPASPNPTTRSIYRFRPPALPAHHRQLRHAGAPRPHRPLLCRGAPREHPEWLTDDAPMWLWFAACSRIRYLPVITAVHRRLPQSVSHSTEYPRRIAFCDSLMDISLWFDARYGACRNRFRILRRRSSVALWVLS